MLENQYINLFTTHLAWTLGSRGTPLVMATNVFQQTRLDAALGDLQLGLDDRVYFFEFKSEETTKKYGGGAQAEAAKSAGIRAHMRDRLDYIYKRTLNGVEEAIELLTIARRGWWFVSGELTLGLTPDLGFISYDSTLFPNAAGGHGKWLRHRNVKNFVDAMLQVPPDIGMSRAEAADLLDALFQKLSPSTTWAASDELLVVTLPPIGTGGTATWSVQTIKAYFDGATVPKRIP